jgi:hypothetical protein
MLSAAYRCVNLMKTKSMSAATTLQTAPRCASIQLWSDAQQRLQFRVVDQAGRVALNQHRPVVGRLQCLGCLG